MERRTFRQTGLSRGTNSGRCTTGVAHARQLSTTADIERKTQQLLQTVVLPLNASTRGPLESNLDKRIPSPTVLLLGNHSSGKSSFINYLLQQRVQDTGVAPTDDCFTVITQGENNIDRDGPSLVGDLDFGFSGLLKFGPTLVNQLKLKVRQEVAIKDIIFIDSPGMIDSPLMLNTAHPQLGMGSGILSGEAKSLQQAQSSMTYRKQHLYDRGYNFEGVVKWFAEKADVILLFFDPDKPGTTGETLSVLTNSLAGLDYKLYIILNKVDQFEKIHDFARAYGSLCWNLSKVIHRKDLPRIYTIFTPQAARLNAAALEQGDSSQSRSQLGSLKDLEQTRTDLINIVLSAPEKRVDNMITQLYTNTKLLDIHVTMVEYVRQQNRRKKLTVYASAALLPTCTVLVDSLLFYFQLGSMSQLAIGNCLSVGVSAGIYYYLRTQFLEFQRTIELDNGSYLQRAFEDLYVEDLKLNVEDHHLGTEVNEEINSLWQIVKPKLRNALRIYKLRDLPTVSSTDLKQIDKVIQVEVPRLRKATSHLQSVREEVSPKRRDEEE